MHDQYPTSPQDDPFTHFEPQFAEHAFSDASHQQFGDSHLGVQIPAGYLPEGLRFTDSEDLWRSSASYDPTIGVPDDTPEVTSRRQTAERAVAAGIDGAYEHNAHAVTTQEDGHQQLKLYLEQSRGVATLSMERFTAPDGTVVDTMSYKQGKSWDSSQILIRRPGMEPRLIGAVTDQKTGEVMARPPGGLYGGNSQIAFNGEQWDRNFKSATAEKPGRLSAALRRRLGRSALGG